MNEPQIKERKAKMENNSAYTSRELLLLKKKRRRKKRLLILLAVLLCLLAAGGGGFFLWQRSRSASQETVQILAGENEEIVYARIDSIVGNEIVTSLLSGEDAAEEMAAESLPLETGEEASAAALPEGEMPPGGRMDATAEGEEAMPQSPADMGQNDAFVQPPADIGQNGASRQLPAGMAQGAGEAFGRSSYSETGETKAWQIPVGTDVITSLGVTTTFSRLSAGDVIAVLTEAGTDNILKIWIVQ